MAPTRQGFDFGKSEAWWAVPTGTKSVVRFLDHPLQDEGTEGLEAAGLGGLGVRATWRTARNMITTGAGDEHVVGEVKDGAIKPIGSTWKCTEVADVPQHDAVVAVADRSRHDQAGVRP